MICRSVKFVVRHAVNGTLFKGSLLVDNVPQQICRFSLDHTAMNIRREARFMKKIMGQHESKKKNFFFDRVDGASRTPTGPLPHNRRRMSMLNKLFMKNITEVMATGTSSQTIEGLGVEICKVSISPDFHIINVLYVCKKKPRPTDLEQALSDVGFRLRHELSQLRLMGEVPRVHFVEDKTIQRLDQIEEILSVADKGSDETSEESAEEINLLEEENMERFNESQIAYGLNHSRILSKVMAAKKAASPHKREDSPPAQISQLSVDDDVKPAMKIAPKRVIAKFLKENKSAKALPSLS